MRSYTQSGTSLYNPGGERLYLNEHECRLFLSACERQRDEIRLLGAFLLHTGVRVSEALNVRATDIQSREGVVVIRSLKKRCAVHFREIYLPPGLGLELERFAARKRMDSRLFPIDRSTAWRWIGAVMHQAGIDGVRACPKGLRHAFGVRAVLAGVPLPVLQKWLGHARLETTTIYTRIVGAEERALAVAMFKNATR